MINLDLLSLLIFVIVLAVIVILNRKKVQFNRLLFPLLYIIMYRTSWGIKLMDKIAKKHRELVKLIGYCCIGIGWAGMIFISYSILRVMLQFLMAPKVSETGMTLVFPGTTIPGIGYLSFWYWLIALFILAVFHEFSHGVMARAHNLEIKSSGFAVLGIIVPVFPAAFVEPDEKKLVKRSDVEQYSIFAAGPIANLVLALIFAIIFFNVFVPLEANYKENNGFTVEVTDMMLPAGQAGITNGTLITSFNGKPIYTWQELVNKLNHCTQPGDVILLGNENITYNIATVPNPDNPEIPLVGIINLKNNIVTKIDSTKARVFDWFKDLFYWMFLLNFFVGLANLLPIYITDGARMLQIALLKGMKNKNRAMKVWTAINAIFLILIIIGLLGNYLKGIIF